MAALTATAAILAGCGSSSSSSSTSAASSAPSGGASTGSGSIKVAKKNIAYVEIFLQAPIEARINNAFDQAAKHVGWSVTTTDAKGDGPTVAQQMQSAINQHVDAIVLGSVEPSLIIPQLNAARAAKIPVVHIAGEARHNNDNLLDGVWNESDVALSTPLGKQICQNVKPGSRIAILRFNLFYSGQLRGDTIKSAAQQCGLKVVAEPETMQTFADAQQKTASILQQFPSLAAIVPVYDTFTAGAVQAIHAAGKTGQVAVYSYYADAINNPLMRANKNVVGLADCDCVKEAAFAVDQLLAHFGKGAPMATTLPNDLINYAVVTRANIPPAGQDGPVAIDSALAPYFQNWDAAYRYGG